MFLVRGQDDIVSRIEERIAAYTMIPQENGEGFQVITPSILHLHFQVAYHPWFNNLPPKSLQTH
jgi:hypothetical protein